MLQGTPFIISNSFDSISTCPDTIFDELKLNASQSEWVGQIEMGQII